MNETSQQQLPITVSWDEQSGVPVPVNQYALLQGPGTAPYVTPIYELHLGHVSPPMINESDYESNEELISKLQMKVIRVGHFQVTIDVLRQLHEGLGQLIEDHESQEAASAK